MTWDMQELVVPGPIAAISAGTLPVSVISTLAFPDLLRSSPFDLRWAGLHIVLGIAFWYGAGRLAEPSRIWRGSLVVFLVLRAISIPASMTFFRNHCHHLRHSRRDDTRGPRSSGIQPTAAQTADRIPLGQPVSHIHTRPRDGSPAI